VDFGAFREKLELHVDFMVKSVWLPLVNVGKYPVILLGCNS